MTDDIRMQAKTSLTHHGSRVPRQEFHVHRAVREALSLDTALFSISGTIIFADISATRRFAYDLEAYRRASGHPDPSVRAGEIAAMGILDEVFHHLLAAHRLVTGGSVAARTLERIQSEVGPERAEETLQAFCRQFPPAAVHRGEQSVGDFLDSTVDGVSGRERAVEEILVLSLTDHNPAVSRYGELFSSSELASHSAYTEVAQAVVSTYSGAGIGDLSVGPRAGSIVDLLLEPARRHPHSLEEQIEYVREQWGAYVQRFLDEILRSLDVLKEEDKVHADPGAGPPPAEVYRYDEGGERRFSPDSDWMPEVVMIAKSTLVWLHQLGKRYGREVKRLDQVPDDEIDSIAAAGFNALWLIGVWERSSASKRIKHLCGNPEAEASAYALYSYDIASGIGGWDALNNLRRRCSDRGIRLASDMVPNHTGIDSPWVAEHPDWYITVDEQPYPAYSFTGENLSGRHDSHTFVEDHYYDRTDASVVFKHVDPSGRERYIYHGNDGTSMPWNDTAQLDYLNPEVREALIQTILHVARNFPIIRFDAAMTLAKRHFRRLWYPEPGSGGDIASRSEHGMSREEFERAFPREFWRDVVDRVAREAPDTLLLAEAFWMMEGYFVRSLGMHRVYNSAFMNMLKREQNADYREIIKNTLAYDREILKRFVNFMNNPDEETAVTQFGTGDKYFAVATLLATLPGLPMFGHGQVEGLAEKYGMEFSRPYWDEQPDPNLIARHEREIFPLIRRRRLFADAGAFRLFDLVAGDGSVNDNVFAYANATGDDRVLVAVNNAYESATGAITTSSPFADDGGERSEHISSTLNLTAGPDRFLVYQEQRSALWHLRRSEVVRSSGIPIDLNGYQSVVFWRIHEKTDTNGSLAKLEATLAGAGVPDLDRALAGLETGQLRSAFEELASPELVEEIDGAMLGLRSLTAPELARLRNAYRTLLEDAREVADSATPSDGAGSVSRGVRVFEGYVSQAASVPHDSRSRGQTAAYRAARGFYFTGIRKSPQRRRLLVEWVFLVPLAEVFGLDQVLSWGADTWSATELDHEMLRIALVHRDWWRSDATPADSLGELLDDDDVRRRCGFNTHAGVEYYHRESLSELFWVLTAVAILGVLTSSPQGGQTGRESVEAAYGVMRMLETANQMANGRVDMLLTGTDSPEEE